MSWFERVESRARDVSLSPPGDVSLRALLPLCDAVLAGYPILYSKGWVSDILTGDFRGNIGKLERVCAALEEAGLPATVAGVLTRAAAKPGGAHDDEGVWGLLWCCRTLRFVAELLRSLGADENLSISAAGRSTYAKTLAAYHASVFSILVSAIVGWAPTRAWVLKHNLDGCSNVAASAACTRTSSTLTPIPEEIIRVLAAAGADFPDRQSSLPFGL
jgi:hypothetical protein